MTKIAIPEWVKSALDEAIERGRYVFDRGWYKYEVMREECDRFDCTVEVWEGRVDEGTYDETYNGEPDPTKQSADLTWRNLNIIQLC